MILDAADEDHEKLQPDAWKFEDYIKKTSIKEILELLTLSYAKEYANDIYWSTLFMDNINENKVFPEEIDPYIDILIENNETTTKEFNKIIFKMYDDSENSCNYTEWMYFQFTNPQELNNLLISIKKGLKGIYYTEKQKESSIIIKPKESAISKITLSSNDIRIDLNPEKWRIYRGF